ncbi:hypothetical protein NKI96_10745 [Mesorhizobium sp. M0292]|uniref:hypothetical protein n=1 Tax=Mesorhizobium sp. M0292 TaxID=2956929 RepID=UPI0033386E88
MKKKVFAMSAAVLAYLALAGCANHGYREGGGHNLYGTHGAGNRDYARNCGMAMDELEMCGGYISPRSF